jgi:Cu+-exporting ATPase
MVAVSLIANQAPRAADPAATVITVQDMHCLGCAKKITSKLNEVPGVAAVRADVPTSQLSIAAQPQHAPSPRALWEAIERAGYHPAKLEGPSGSFTAKPQS